MMKNIKDTKSIFAMTRNILLYERTEKRVIMGFLVGMALPLWWLKNFLDYVVSTGEPVNILEAFPVTVHEGGSMLFLVLGWFLVISDAPFVSGNTYYSLYRTKKRRFHGAMVVYIFVQAAIYTAAAAVVTVLVSLPHGFVGKMWSNPVYMLSRDFGAVIYGKYGTAFAQQDMMRHTTVPQAFAATMLCFFLYLAVTGMILYTLSLLIGGMWGVLVTVIVHFSGMGLSYPGFVKFALIRYSRAGNFADYEGLHLAEPVGKMILIIGVLAVLGNVLIEKAEFRGK